jgi:hypothetical protein
MVLDQKNMRASLAIFKYAIEYIRLNVGHIMRLLFKFTNRLMRSIVMLLKES